MGMELNEIINRKLNLGLNQNMHLHHIALSVRNLETSVNFYQDIFGFTEVKSFARPDLKGKAIFLKLGEMQLELWQFEQQIERQDNLSKLNVLGIKLLAFAVENIETKREELKKKNITTTEPKFGGSGARYCFFKDPDGIPLELYELSSNIQK